MTSSPHPRRHPIRSRWRVAFVLLILALIVSTVWLGRRFQTAWRQREAIRQLQETYNIDVSYSMAVQGYDSVSDQRSKWPDWLQRLLGIDFFLDVPEVMVLDPVAPEELAILRNLRGLRDLFSRETAECEYDDRHLAVLASLRLRSLYLANVLATDKGMSSLAEMESLEEFSVTYQELSAAHASLRNTPGIGDAWLSQFARTNRLKRLGLCCAGVSDAGLRELPRMTRLESLTLKMDAISNAGVKSITRLTNLRRLVLRDMELDDEGVALIAGMPSLEELRVDGIMISAEGLRKLSSMPKLRILATNELSLHHEDLEALRQFPRLESLYVFFVLPPLLDSIPPEEFPATNELAIAYGGNEFREKDFLWLAKLQNLKRLDLSRTELTDAQLPMLRHLGQLTSLSLPRTVSQSACDKIREILPQPGLSVSRPASREIWITYR